MVSSKSNNARITKGAMFPSNKGRGGFNHKGGNYRVTETIISNFCQMQNLYNFIKFIQYNKLLSNLHNTTTGDINMQDHSAGRAPTSDWSATSFIIREVSQNFYPKAGLKSIS